MQHRGVLHADGDDHRLRDDDRQRDGLVPVTTAAFLDGRDVNDDHRVIILDIDSRALFVIQRGAQVGQVDAGFLGDAGELHVGWFGQAQPGAVLRFLNLFHLAVNRSEHSQHVSHPPFALSDVLSLYGSPRSAAGNRVTGHTTSLRIVLCAEFEMRRVKR